MGEAVDVARRLAEGGVEVVISRGATAGLIAAALPELSVVDLSTSALDLITALHRRARRRAHIAVVAFPPMSAGAVEIGRMLGVEVTVHELRERGRDRARGSAAPIVQGARRHRGRLHHRAWSPRAWASPASRSRRVAPQHRPAVEEAKRIVHARARWRRRRRQLLRAVLTFTDNGILAVDRDGLVTLVNPIAARLLRIGEDDVVGQPIRALWPKLGLEKVVATGAGEIGQIDRLFDQDLICNTIADHGRRRAAVGAVATFHDVRQIQQHGGDGAKAHPGHRPRRHARASTDILGASPALRQAIATGADFAATPATVLIQGETGTGQGAVRAGHPQRQRAPRRRPSWRSTAPRCRASCWKANSSATCRAPSPAPARRASRASSSSPTAARIFLDEIAEMDLPTQGKLLRVLQEKRVMRLGSDQVIPVDVRVIAATNKNLKQLVADGSFRDDLYYRLNVLQLRLPALRQRAEDIPLLAERFLRLAATSPDAHALSAAALRELARHAWPGNVRELQNIMARVSATLREKTVSGKLVAQLLEDADGAPFLAGLPSERERIGHALAQSGGRMAETARTLGISRSTLWRKMRRLKVA